MAYVIDVGYLPFDPLLVSYMQRRFGQCTQLYSLLQCLVYTVSTVQYNTPEAEVGGVHLEERLQ